MNTLIINQAATCSICCEQGTVYSLHIASPSEHVVVQKVLGCKTCMRLTIKFKHMYKAVTRKLMLAENSGPHSQPLGSLCIALAGLMIRLYLFWLHCNIGR